VSQLSILICKQWWSSSRYQLFGVKRDETV
jgi:hypothetical protein